MRETAKRFMVLLAMLALMLAAAGPTALAQEQEQYGSGEVSATGVIFPGLPADAGGFGTHSISDDATGTLYALRSAGPDLDSYGSQRVTVYGALTPGVPGSGEEGIEGNGTLPTIDVTRVEPAGEPIEGEATPCDEFLPGGEPNPDYDPTLPECVSGDGITATFELAVQGELPAGATFYGLVGQQPTQLTDPDGDGLYEGVLTLTADFGTFPIPVAIVAGDPAKPQSVIKDFGEIVLEDGDVFSAVYSFGGPPPGPSPENSATFAYELAVECEPPADAGFLGLTATESLVTTPLTDPDGDGVYTGSQTIPRFAPGGPEEPITISPVRIVQGPPTGTGPLGPEYRVIKDFGPVTAEDTTLSASVSFCDGGPGGNGGDTGGGSDGGAVVSGDTNDDEGGNGGGSEGGVRVLPETGGAALLLVGALLLTGVGLLMRRVMR